MAVPSSGPLGLYKDIWGGEIGGAQANTSLHGASIYAGFSTPDAISDFYGWSDVEVPTVTSNGASSVGTTSMVANGTVNTTGNENPDRGFYFGTSTNRTSNPKYSVGTGGTGGFSRTMTGLSYTTYYYWAYASNSAGETVGARISQVTAVPSFSVSLAAVGFGISLNRSQCFQAQASNTKCWANPYTGATTATSNYSNFCCNFNGSADGCLAINARNIMAYNAQNYQAPNWYYGFFMGGKHNVGSGYTFQGNHTNNKSGLDSIGSALSIYCNSNTCWNPQASIRATNYCACWQNGQAFPRQSGSTFANWCVNAPSDIRLKSNINYL